MRTAYEIAELPNGSKSIRSVADGETFHPVAGPFIEAEALYVRQLRLVERLSLQGDPFVIWDVGLGSAANVCTALHLSAHVPSNLHIISFDRDMKALRFALDHADDLTFLAGFGGPIQHLLQHQAVEFSNGDQHVRWTAIIGDFPERVGRAGKMDGVPPPHAVFFDAFSPARNPEMWSLELFQGIKGIIPLTQQCSLATYTRSTLVRTALLLAGFYVGPGVAIAGKEETTVAATDWKLLPALLTVNWLHRARRSQAAEPLHDRQYKREPLKDLTWQRLCGHPQFARQ